MKERKDKKVCPKCEWKNPKEASFCLKCGSKIEVVKLAERASLEGLIFVHIVGSLYAILSVAFNAYVRVFPFYLLFYVVSGILGLAAAYALHQEKGRKWMKTLLSFATVALGLVGTFRLFLISQLLRAELRELLPLVGPAWIIFVITGFKLWQDRNRL